jgi:hypothetical protein
MTWAEVLRPRIALWDFFRSVSEKNLTGEFMAGLNENFSENPTQFAHNAAKKAGDTAATDSFLRPANPLPTGTVINLGSTERLLSVAGGLLLFGWGMYRRGLLGYGAMMTATALWDRGVRGHCGLYAALGKTTVHPAKAANGTVWPGLPQVG